jgi:hypothetical protein
MSMTRQASVAKGERVRQNDLQSGNRMRKVIEARKVFCQLSVRKMVYSGAEAARFLVTV